MKINFKKITSILATTVMLGSTIAFAAAAYPEPFVKSGAGDAAIVVGASAAATDTAAATDLGASLDSKITTTGAVTISGGDSIKIEKTNDKFNLVNTADSFYSTMDESELTKVLAEGIYTNDDNTDYDYEQSISLGVKSLNLTHFQNDDFNNEKPVIGFNLINNEHILNYTLKFTPTAVAGGTAWAKLETTDLTMLGTSYYIIDATTTTNGIKLTLLDNANSATVSETEPKTVVVGDKSYEVSIDFVDSASAILVVNGVTTNKLAAGDVYKVAPDTYVAIKNLLYNGKESGTSKVEFSIGSGKIVIEDNQEVKMNDKFISEDTDMALTAVIVNSSTDLTSITLSWDLEDEFWIAPGTDLVLPGFKTIKLSMTDFKRPAEEMTTLKASTDEVFKIKTTVKDGPLDIALLYNNASNILGLGEKVKHNLVTWVDYLGQNTTSAAAGSALNVTLVSANNTYFVASWSDGADDFESYAFEIDSITNTSGKVVVELKNLATNTNDLKFSEVLDTDEIGRIKFTLAAADAVTAKKDAIVSVEAASSGTVYLDRIFTKEGLTIQLPVYYGGVTDDINPLEISTGKNSTSWKMNMTEEDKDGNIAKGKYFTATLTINADDGLEPSTIAGGLTSAGMVETESGSNIYQGYIPSDLATKLTWTKPSSSLKSLDVSYAGQESYGEVYISESSTVTTSSASIKVVKDSEVSSVSSSNLIVIGGACINKAAAMIVAQSESALCGDDWATKTGAGVGKYLIQVAANPYNAGKIAMLVAGYDAADTTAAIAKVKEGNVDTSKNSATVYPLAV